MSEATPALLAAAAGVGFAHAVLPDHWLPLAVLARTRRYSFARVARLSGLAAVTHVLVSIVLGGVVIVVGLQFRATVERAQSLIVGGLLVATGIGVVTLEARGGGHGHAHGPGGPHHHHHHHAGEQQHRSDGPEPSGRLGGLAVMVPFGAAASPDLTILPVFLAASATGTRTAVASLVVFAAVTVATILGLTLLACFGGLRVRAEWLERRGNLVTALVLVLIGTLVLAGVL